MKALIFDSGPLINLSMNGFLPILEELKKNFDGKFLITQEVKYEVVDHPIGIRRFELGALRVQNLIERGVLELPSAVGISDNLLKKEARNLMNIANQCVEVNGRIVEIVSEAEMSCLALSSALSSRGVENIIAVDERTTRILAEKPNNLEKLMSEKFREKVNIKCKNLGVFTKYKFIRSTEIVFVAYKKGLLNLKGKKALEAALYATRFKGSAVSFEEIEEMKRL